MPDRIGTLPTRLNSCQSSPLVVNATRLHQVALTTFDPFLKESHETHPEH
jgi:hypothetical protein